MRNFFLLAGLLLGLFTSSSQAANVAFTIYGVVSQAGVGYTLGQDVKLTMVVAGAYYGSTMDIFTTDFNGYYQEGPSMLPLYLSVFGTGLTGTPTASSDIGELTTQGNFLTLSLYNYDDSSLNVSANGQALHFIRVGFFGTETWTYPGMYTSPEEYFLHSGPYLLMQSTGTSRMTMINTLSEQVGIEIIYMGIQEASSESIPEPSTWTLLGLGAGLVIWQLRRRIVSPRGNSFYAIPEFIGQNGNEVEGLGKR